MSKGARGASVRARRVSSPLPLILAFAVAGAGLAAGSAGSRGELGFWSAANASSPDQIAARSLDFGEIASVFAPPPGSGEEVDLATMLERVLPAVVSIRQLGGAIRHPSDLGTLPFATPDMNPELVRGVGSGFLLRDDGLIVTNYHVVAGAAKLEVHLADGRRFEGKVVGSDPQTDTALVKIEGEGPLPTLSIAEHSKVRVGDWVIAVGSPMGLEQTVTRGIVSAKGRGDLGLYRNGYVDFLQTDAAISPGSSGGPLVDLKGRVVGMNTAVGGIGRGLGFAVPAEQLASVVRKLEKDGKVARGWLGISGRNVEPARYGELPERGAVVGQVFAAGPAAKAGLMAGDRITAVDGREVRDFLDFRGRVADLAPKTKAKLDVVRDGKAMVLTVTLGAVPSDDDLASLAQGQPLPAAPPATSPSTPPLNSDRLWPDGKPKLGVELAPDPGGMKIERVADGSLAAQLGLQVGDILTEVNGVAITQAGDVTRSLANHSDRVSVTVRRGRGTHTAAIMRR